MGAAAGDDATDTPPATTIKQGLDKRVDVPRVEGREGSAY